jgi:tetratricopeptide (TPR) repeat protein
MNKATAIGLLAMLVSAFSGCMTIEPEPTEALAPTRTGDADVLLISAESLAREADERGKLDRLIEVYESALAIEPANRTALRNLAQYHVLLGTGYSSDIEQKKRHFRAAIAYSERLMYLNEAFRQRVASGEAAWEASDVLTADDADGMGWWSTAVFFYFKECVPDAYKIFNAKWANRSKSFLDRIDSVAPDWQGGANYFNLAIYYLAVPEEFGGDRVKSYEYLQKAVAAGPRRLLFPWGRAKYYYYTIKDRKGFESDLEWVLAQDPHASTGDEFPWNVYFQTEARALLGSADALF